MFDKYFHIRFTRIGTVSFYIKELTCPPKSHFHLQTQHVMDPQKMDHNRHHLKRSCHQDHVTRDHFEQDKLKSNFLNSLLEIMDLNIAIM